MIKKSRLSTQIYGNFNNLRDLVRKGIGKELPKLTESSPYVAASELDDELKSSEKNDILYEMLTQFFDVRSNVTPVFESNEVAPGCVGVQGRILKDTEEYCSEENYRNYVVQGKCLNAGRPGAGLANRAMTRLGSPVCTQNNQNTLGGLPTEREVSLAIGKYLKENPFEQRGQTPNLIALTLGQFVTHDTTQRVFQGNVNGESQPFSCGRNNRLLPNVFDAQINDEMKIQAEDPFYGIFGVRCLPIGKNRIINENCKLQKASIVRPYIVSTSPNIS